MTPPSHVADQPRPGPDAPNAAADAIAAAEQQRVLVAELNHRVRNMLQVVIGIANQTLRRSADIKEFEQDGPRFYPARRFWR